MTENYNDYYNRRMRQLDREQYWNNLACLAFGVGGFLGMIIAGILMFFGII